VESAEIDPPPPAIHVAVPQPVYPERDAPPPAVEVPPAAPDQKVRVAGRIQPPGSHNNLADILLDDRPMHLMQGHALGSLRREVAGFMLGPLPEKQPDGRYLVHVTDAIIAQYTKMSGASVTYTPESWRYAQDVLNDRYPDGNMVMVGWYHTHPGFGIFLSNMDLFIHTNFFTQKWHIAYVLDPVARRSGFFSWDRPQRQVIPYQFPWPDWAAGSW
jgi:proteasome lid subunit RPN8/RPN11